MPYVIIAKVESNTDPLIVARICRAQLVDLRDGRKIYTPMREPSVATVVRDPASEPYARTYCINPLPEGTLAGLAGGSYLDLSTIKDVIENHTDETCRIRSSA
jgi:hypothetical protein